MQEDKEPNSHVQKSSFQLEEEQIVEKQPQESSNNYPQLSAETVLEEEQVELQNLLDLQAPPHNLEEHSVFLKDRIVIIEGPELVTENVLKSYKLYIVKSRKKSEDSFDTSVARRFSDFEYLQKQLIQKYGGYIIPLLPQKNFWANINMEGHQYMKKRARDLEKYLRSLLAHERLRMTEQLKHFLFSDEKSFSEEKGEFFSKIKTEEKIYSLAETAFNYSKGLFSKFISGNQQIENEGPQIHKPSLEDLKLMDYERDVGSLVKILNVLRDLVENTATEMRVMSNFSKMQGKESSQIAYQKLLQSFQDLCKYIISCNEALKRRNAIRVSIDDYNKQYENIQKKIKTNPRSQEVDILRNKLAKATEKCSKWTKQLLGELEKSVSLGRSMVEGFVLYYTELKEGFYRM